MPLMAAYEQNDARDAAKLLATMTLEGLRDRRQDGLVGNAINNMYRLLRGYQSHGFYGCVEGHHADEDGSMTSLLSSGERNVGDLKLALDAAFGDAYRGQQLGPVIDGLKVVLRMVAYPKAGEAPDAAAVKQADEFFTLFLKKLES